MRTLSLRLLCVALIGTVAPVSLAAENAAPRFQSQVEGLAITAVSSVPAFKGRDDEQRCFDPMPESREAVSVQAKGWQVTGEAEAGGYRLVSFAGSMEQGTSGSCLLGDGNIALFRDGDVQAIAYATQGASLSIGYIQALEPDDIRILDGDFLTQPVADMRFDDDGSVRIEKLAASESVCTGLGQVPNIYGLPINRARSVLGEAGWEPSPARHPGGHSDGRASTFASQGLTEVDDCSGTGFGYCQFFYEGTPGLLAVITAGDDEWPSVVRYSVDCDGY
ncbi:hypothetical protein [Pelagibacterium limicola]|uniref:hypothetical protein n=1 Tax=Pelagibacterium limicola TaxID=2791022 RepID=UPI0018AF9E9D|nr:hypothetical protein [Pelagibacterium limicola]